jgi:ribosomal-protein-alanine N-acetyltransferase
MKTRTGQTGRMHNRPRTTIRLLTDADEADVLAFEIANRAFFAAAVGDRGDAYFSEFPERHRALASENDAGTLMMFLVRDADDRLVGRVNLVDIADGAAELGYRIGEHASGQGHASAAVRLALEAAADRGITRIAAKTTSNNAASRRVLERSGFVRQPSGTPSHLTVGEVEHPAVHYARDTRSA